MPDDPNRPVRPDGEDATPSDEPADSVEEADKESFPASDPPASWAGGDGH